MSYHKNDVLSYVGKKFNSLTVLSVHSQKQGRYYFLCKCGCGREKVLRADHVVNGDTVTCGCHNGKRNPIEHNLSRTRLYGIWDTMRNRCYNPKCKKYPTYGGRGIHMCDEWKNDFLSFYSWANENGYSDNLTIDRIDVNGDYCPENCRWSTMAEQQRNKRNTLCVTYNGQTKPLIQWCDELHLPFKTIQARVYALHWSLDEPEKLFFTPVRANKGWKK